MQCLNPNCSERIFQDGMCHKHYYYDRWHPKHGPQALKRYLFECLPEWFDRTLGCPPFMMEAITLLYEGVMSEKGAMQGNALALFMWRGAGKSTLVKGVASWVIAYSLKEFIRYRGNTADGSANEFMDGLMDMMLSSIYTTVFGVLIQDNRSRSMEHRTRSRDVVCKNTVKTRINIKGADQTGLGALSKKKRVDWGIGDDMESMQNTRTPESRNKIKLKIIKEDLPACTERKSFYTYLTTPHPDGTYDLIHTIAKKEGLFKIVEYWIYKQDERGSWLLDEKGERVPQWPEKFPLEACKNKEKLICADPELGWPVWNSEYLGILITDKERPIPEECIQYREYNYTNAYNQNWVTIKTQNGIPLAEQKTQTSFVVMGVDPAISEKGTACDSAGTILDVLWGFEIMYRTHFAGKYRLQDILHDHTQRNGHPIKNPREIELNHGNIKQEGIVGKVFRMIVEHKPDLVVVEDVSGYKTVYQIIEETRRLWYLHEFRDHYFELLPFSPEINYDSKLDRISRSLRGDFETMNAYIRGKLDGDKRPQERLIEQLVNLGNTKLVDIVDAASSARIHAKLPPEKKFLTAVKRYLYPDEPSVPKPISSYFMEMMDG